MRTRGIILVAIIAAFTIGLTTTASASSASPRSANAGPAKAPKAKAYEYCDIGVGCWEWSIYTKTKTWEFTGYGTEYYGGPYEKVGTETRYYENGTGCIAHFPKAVKKVSHGFWECPFANEDEITLKKK
jgi:hypothetical protein